VRTFKGDLSFMTLVKVCAQILPHQMVGAASWVQTKWTATHEKAHNLRIKVHHVFRTALIKMLFWLEGTKLDTPLKDQLDKLQEKITDESRKITESFANIQIAVSEILALETLKKTQEEGQNPSE
jgi:hypothetical protein